MTNKQLKNLKSRLWQGADQLRANSGLKSTEYATPILGLIFLRFAQSKYSQYEAAIIAEYKKLKGSRAERPIHEIAIGRWRRQHMTSKKKNEISIRSSAAEYLTFVTASGESGVEAIYADENVWLSQKMMAALYDVNVRTVNEHLIKIFSDNELDENSVIRNFRITASDGKNYDTKFHKATKRIFATVQNKLHWAIHGHTAAELIVERADAEKQHMGLTTWKDVPKGKIQKFDVSVANNYLSEFEMGQLERLVNAYLDIAELQATRKIPMTMSDWESRLNRFIEATDRDILRDAGRVTAEIAKQHAETEFEKYRIVQDRLFESDFDRFVALETEVEEMKDGNDST